MHMAMAHVQLSQFHIKVPPIKDVYKLMWNYRPVVHETNDHIVMLVCLKIMWT